MTKHKLSTLKQGEIFSRAGQEFVVLDHLDDGTLCLLKDVLPPMAFSEASLNDWRYSDVKKYLNTEWLNELIATGLDAADIIPMTIDLKATDGSREYGYDICNVSLLTVEQYFRYNEYIPLAEYWWMLATPHQTPECRSPDIGSSTYFWNVLSNGSGSWNSASSSSHGPRPASLFSSDLLVSKSEDEQINLYAKYMTYLNGFSNSDQEIGASPMNFEVWTANYKET